MAPGIGIIFRKEDKEWLLMIRTIIHIMLSGHITEPNFSINHPVPTWVPSMLMDLPVLGDTFCRFCTGEVCLLPSLWRYGDPTQSLICRTPLDSSSSLFFPASWFAPKLLMLLLLCPWCWGLGMPSRVHRFFSTESPEESVPCGRKTLPWPLVCKRWRQWLCRKACECARFYKVFDI